MADDYPDTQLDDDEYEAFLAREFDSQGRAKGDPPIGRYVAFAVVALIVLAIWLLR
jgi:hypothetical protein